MISGCPERREKRRVEISGAQGRPPCRVSCVVCGVWCVVCCVLCRVVSCSVPRKSLKVCLMACCVGAFQRHVVMCVASVCCKIETKKLCHKWHEAGAWK